MTDRRGRCGGLWPFVGVALVPAATGARKTLRAAVTAASAQTTWLTMLVPDGMGGGFHVDFLLLTMARGSGRSTCATCRAISSAATRWPSGPSWTVRGVFTFTNPADALDDRIAAVKAVAGEVPVEGASCSPAAASFRKVCRSGP